MSWRPKEIKSDYKQEDRIFAQRTKEGLSLEERRQMWAIGKWCFIKGKWETHVRMGWCVLIGHVN